MKAIYSVLLLAGTFLFVLPSAIAEDRSLSNIERIERLEQEIAALEQDIQERSDAIDNMLEADEVRRERLDQIEDQISEIEIRRRTLMDQFGNH